MIRPIKAIASAREISHQSLSLSSGSVGVHFDEPANETISENTDCDGGTYPGTKIARMRGRLDRRTVLQAAHVQNWTLMIKGANIKTD